jgi:hypothetical protein
LLGSTTPSDLRARVETHRLPFDLAVAAIQNAEVEIARQPSEHALHLRERAANLLHVAPRHHMRQTRRGRHLLDVILRRLRFVANRQLVVRKNLRRAHGHLDQLCHAKRSESRAGALLFQQVAPDQSRVRLTDLHKQFARAVVGHAHHVQTSIRLAFT